MAGSAAQDSALLSAMANLEVSPESKVLDLAPGVDLESKREDEAEETKDFEKVSRSEEDVDKSPRIGLENEDSGEKDGKKGDVCEDAGESVEAKAEGEDETVESREESGGSVGTVEDGGSVEAESSVKDGVDVGSKSVESTEAKMEKGEVESDVQVVMSAATMMGKLNIAESSDGASNGGDDDLSSSLDSTANSGPRLASEDKVASSEDCSEEGSVRPKKRIDLQHQFVRGIVKIQHDRDQYEKQCQTRKQEERDVKTPDKAKPETSTRKPSSSQRSPPFQDSKRQFSSVDTPALKSSFKPQFINEEQAVDKPKPDRTAAIYRPPNLRHADTDTNRTLRGNEAESGRSGRNTEADTSLTRNTEWDTGRISRSTEVESGRSTRNAEADTVRSSAPSSRRKTRQGSPAKVPVLAKEFDKDILPENLGIRVTFDTEKQKRRIQLAKPQGPKEREENNFIVTFDTTKKERHIEVPGFVRGAGKVSHNDSPGGVEVKEKIFGDGFKRGDIGDLPASFEFKATAFGKGPTETKLAEDNEATFGKRSGRNRSRGFKGSATVRTHEAAATQRHTRGGNGVNILEISPKRNGGIPLPPKDKPFAAELKWGDIVDSEVESPVSTMENSSNSSPAPDVLESNQWHNNGQSSSTGRKPLSSSKKHRHKKSSPPPRQVQLESPVSDAPRRSVWERLGPRPVVETSRLRTAQYENSTMVNSLENFREAAERDYFQSRDYGEPSEQPVQAAYKDAKQKRSRLELYVPRRGGSQA